jgi:hypothetical protein
MERTDMKVADISLANDPDLRASITAIHRAAELARKTAIQTGTSLVIVDEGQLRRIPAEKLIKDAAPNGDQTP